MRGYLLCLLGVVVLAGCASSPNSSTENTGSPKLKSVSFLPKNTPFIKQSAIIYPSGVNNLQLSDTHIYPDPIEGVQIRYKARKFPRARIDLFVYPAGSLKNQDEALNREMSEILGEVKALKKYGIYQAMKLEGGGGLTIDVEQGPKIPGREAIMSLTMKNKSFPSLAYVFYHQYYWIEVRISSPGTKEKALETLGSEVIRKLVPRVVVQSLGTCGHDGITVIRSKPDGFDASKSSYWISSDGFSMFMTPNAQFGKGLVKAGFIQARHGCSNVVPVAKEVFQLIKQKQSDGKLQALWLQLSKKDWARISAREHN